MGMFREASTAWGELGIEGILLRQVTVNGPFDGVHLKQNSTSSECFYVNGLFVAPEPGLEIDSDSPYAPVTPQELQTQEQYAFLRYLALDFQDKRLSRFIGRHLLSQSATLINGEVTNNEDTVHQLDPSVSETSQDSDHKPLDHVVIVDSLETLAEAAEFLGFRIQSSKLKNGYIVWEALDIVSAEYFDSNGMKVNNIEINELSLLQIEKVRLWVGIDSEWRTVVNYGKGLNSGAAILQVCNC